MNATVNVQRDALRYAEDALTKIRTDMNILEGRVQEIQGTKNESEVQSKLMTELSEAFGSRGIQTFLLQNTVSLLEQTAQHYLDQLSDGAQRLQLSLESGDRIIRRAYVRGDGEQPFKERPLAALSGGQWKRCSLSLSLAFADIVARRGRFRSSICVFDEPLTHLDQSGRAHVGRALRRLLRQTSEDSYNENFQDTLGLRVSTILIILQDLAAEELEESFDCIDEVVKEQGRSSVRIDELTN
jgi:DNA repair exonuclease SbcCD ATPase subunit